MTARRVLLPVLAVLLAAAGPARALQFVQAVKDVSYELDTAWGVVVSHDGANVYATGPSRQGLVSFSRDPVSGRLTVLQRFSGSAGPSHVPNMGNPTGIVVSPDDRHVYVTAGFTKAVVVFEREAGTGRLVYVGAAVDGVDGVEGLDYAVDVVVSPDGRHVYVAADLDDSVVAFERDPATGLLTFLAAYYDGVGGVSGLDGAFALDVSPDGRNVYVAGDEAHTAVVFARDPATGLLTWLEKHTHGVNGVLGLFGSHGVRVSPDGHQVYAGGPQGSMVVHFDRDQTTGRLTYQGGSPFAAEAKTVLTPDGTRLFAVGLFGWVGTYARDPATGNLTSLGVIMDGQACVDGIGGSAFLALSPDARHLYVTGFTDDALAVFSMGDELCPCGNGRLDVGEECDDGNVDAGDCCSAICTAEPDDGACDDGDQCTLGDRCASGACAPGDERVACAPCEACLPDRGCAVGPRDDCRAPVEATLGLQRQGTRHPTRLGWAWTGAGGVPAAPAGPEEGMSLCLFDLHGDEPALLSRLDAPGDAARGRHRSWRSLGDGRIAFTGPARHPLRRLRLGTDRAGRTTIHAHARGALLPDGQPPVPLPLAVQLQDRGGACWEATYVPAGVRRNGPRRVRGVASGGGGSAGGAFLD
jgi:cysteine-rich repeat protein